MSIPIFVYFALSSSLTNTAAIPLIKGAQITLWQFLSLLAHTNFPINFLVLLGSVSIWRGAWGLMDLHIFPENTSLSYLVSLVIGLVIMLTSYDLATQFL